MIHELNWKGRDTYHLLEKCVVNTSGDDITIHAAIEGMMDNVQVKARYMITTDTQWRTKAFELTYLLNGTQHTLNFNGDTEGNWLKDGTEQPALKGCIEIDITATPFTNTLAVNRLNLAIGESREIKVLYVDVLENTVTLTEQVYTRIADHTYHFATGDFETEIQFDEFGFVVDYPGLFERID